MAIASRQTNDWSDGLHRSANLLRCRPTDATNRIWPVSFGPTTFATPMRAMNLAITHPVYSTDARSDVQPSKAKNCHV